jgi:ABC-type multidrug transport system fused ATPase/permease subunit
MTITQKSILTIILICLSILLFFSSHLNIMNKLPVLDKNADRYFTESITKAGLAYATCRVINASVSIIKDSSLHLEPAGVGISFAAGQAVDPIDDMTERLSDVLVTAITAIGLMKLGHEIAIHIAPGLLAVLLLIATGLLWINNKKTDGVKKLLVGVIIIIVVGRICLPISAAVNDYLNNQFFYPQITEIREKLSLQFTALEQLNDYTLPENKGVLGTLENSAQLIKQKTIALQKAMKHLAANMGEMIDSLLKLSFLYVGVFLIQIILIPILMFWFLNKLINTSLQLNLPSKQTE